MGGVGVHEWRGGSLLNGIKFEPRFESLIKSILVGHVAMQFIIDGLQAPFVYFLFPFPFHVHCSN